MPHSGNAGSAHPDTPTGRATGNQICSNLRHGRVVPLAVGVPGQVRLRTGGSLPQQFGQCTRVCGE
eukprot:4864839-Alexandrium_andersonii.AAC.1